ncbi:unnamed protein product [Caenorhabditis angaria]|uniref:Uncharacterized protein n=1 Tax=Caenorhabditis angaria TaxID=860376 RepID=A0A9P1IX10_9PELO|nr:unnamed protein product [Caenorhabditis angaria]CAI5453857.1 unnamed protein product [Caenorhabditis angaria]CAI5453858.1 unnamed protein product [Caenorhabditis angaria]CAI5453859.1 unnamed protein product [Caenorhabditis angaria]CAI5453860.1 unnamed protein product [Caenorhabditis angaria]
MTNQDTKTEVKAHTRRRPQSCAEQTSTNWPIDPTTGANPFPEVTDLVCRLPLPTLFYRLEAVHLGDLMRISVRLSAN